jgi:urease accessory protein
MRLLQQDPPWRAVRAFRNEAGEALVHLHNVSGGIVAGDALRLEVKLERNAQAQVTSTGATRVYRSHRATASQTTTVQIGAGALLEYLPDAIIPFSGSSFRQSSDFELTEGAGLIWWETLAAGRIAHGESFAFENFAAETSIRSPNRPLVLERYSLSPKLQEMQSPARMGSFLYSAVLYVCRVDENTARWAALEGRLSELADHFSNEEERWGASVLAQNGVVVRGLARHAHQITKGLHSFWKVAKWEVWGTPALLPRKVH